MGSVLEFMRSRALGAVHCGGAETFCLEVNVDTEDEVYQRQPKIIDEQKNYASVNALERVSEGGTVMKK